MNKERIDSLFEVLNFGDVDEYKMYQEIQAFFSMEGYNGETLSNFMQDIEKSGLIDYFLSKAEENKKNKEEGKTEHVRVEKKEVALKKAIGGYCIDCNLSIGINLLNHSH